MRLIDADALLRRVERWRDRIVDTYGKNKERVMSGCELLQEWQDRLCLQDWRIILCDNLKPEEMTDENVAGCTVWNETIKAARIEILNPEYYGSRMIPFDYEETLVHELLHLKTSLVSDGVCELQERYMHQMIDDLARALVNAKRFEQKEGESDG